MIFVFISFFIVHQISMNVRNALLVSVMVAPVRIPGVDMSASVRGTAFI